MATMMVRRPMRRPAPELPDAPRFTWRNWIGLIGPGLLMGGASIGGGEWLLGPSVTVRVEPADDTSGADLFLGRGRSDDLTAYAQDANVSRVVGLTRSRELDVRAGPGPVAALPQGSQPIASTTAAPSSESARGTARRHDTLTRIAA